MACAPGASHGGEPSASLAQLKEVFPLVDSDTLLNVIECTNSIERAVAWLLEQPLEHPYVVDPAREDASIRSPVPAVERPQRDVDDVRPPEQAADPSRQGLGFGDACGPERSHDAHKSSQGTSPALPVAPSQESCGELESMMPSSWTPPPSTDTLKDLQAPRSADEEAARKPHDSEKKAGSPCVDKKRTLGRSASAAQTPGEVQSPAKRKLGRSISGAKTPGEASPAKKRAASVPGEVQSPARRKLGRSTSGATTPGQASPAKKRAASVPGEASPARKTAERIVLPLAKVPVPLACSAPNAATFAWASLKTKTSRQANSFGPETGSTWLWFLVCELQARHKQAPGREGITEVRIKGDKFQAGWLANPELSMGVSTLQKHQSSMLQSALDGTLNEYGSHRRGAPEGFSHSWSYSDSTCEVQEATLPVTGVTWTEVKGKDRWRVDVRMQWHTAKCINCVKEGRHLFVADQRAEKLNPNQYATAMRGAMTYITNDVEGRDALLRTIQLYQESVASKTSKGKGKAKGQECLTKWVKGRASKDPPQGSSSAEQSSPEKQ